MAVKKNTQKKSYKQRYGKWLLLSLLGFLISSFFIYKLIQYYYDGKNIIYKGFEIAIPSGYGVHGIDVSRYQRVIKWKAVRDMESSGVTLSFAFMKATEGLTLVDPQFRRNWAESQKAGIIRGAYHFFRPSKNAKAQAENFLQMVKLEAGDLPPVLDVEVTEGVGKTEMVKSIQTWLDIVESRTGVKPIIYTNVHFYTSYMAGTFDEYPLWVAHYISPNGPRIEREWQFWQHSEKGRVNGISSYVDFNVYNGSLRSLKKLLITENDE